MLLFVFGIGGRGRERRCTICSMQGAKSVGNRNGEAEGGCIFLLLGWDGMRRTRIWTRGGFDRR